MDRWVASAATERREATSAASPKSALLRANDSRASSTRLSLPSLESPNLCPRLPVRPAQCGKIFHRLSAGSQYCRSILISAESARYSINIEFIYKNGGKRHQKWGQSSPDPSSRGNIRACARLATGEAQTAMRRPRASEPHAFRAHAAGLVKSEPELRAT